MIRRFVGGFGIGFVVTATIGFVLNQFYERTQRGLYPND